jgi:hypothetical protein
MSNTPRTNAYAAQGREWIPLGIFEKLERELNEAKQQATDFCKAWVESDADRLRLREAVRLMYDASPVSYVYACDKARALINSPPPPVVDKVDADALADALECATQHTQHMDFRLACQIESKLEVYRAKYQEIK